MQLVNVEFVLLLISTILIFLLLFNILNRKPLKQLQKAFAVVLICILIICMGVIMQLVCSTFLDVNPIYFENFIYIGTCFLPVSLFFTAIIFKNTKIHFKRLYLLLFIIPILTLGILYTNDYHHLFYEKYSSNLNEMIFGSYFYIHTVYTYALIFISIAIMLSVSLKSTGIFSKQPLLFILGTLAPIVINILGTLKIINMNVCLTPISFSIAILIFSFAIFKFNFLNISPIALRKIVDKISDSYVVLDDDNTIIDFNKTFLATFRLEEEDIQTKNLLEFLEKHKNYKIDEDKLKKSITEAVDFNKTVSYEQHCDIINKFFMLEITSISAEKSSLGTLILFKDITQHKEDMQTIKDNQDTIMESERLASLGQLIGGIAHNLKTPIMSISGAAEGLSDLVNEYNLSIENSSVTPKDHHEIANDMKVWIDKIKDYTEYMSDVITAVKGQAVTLSESENTSFDLEELVKRIDILMKHELKSAILYLRVHMYADSKTVIYGDVNSLVQVINNMISNAIQAYAGKTEEEIFLEFKTSIVNGINVLIITVEDHACGLPDNVKQKLFKEMITTKGKNGTGLGLYMSYSTIKAHFNGNISFESEEGKGTRFHICLPI